MDIDMTVWGKCIFSSSTGRAGLHNVSPVAVFLGPTAATMSPALASSWRIRSSACIFHKRLTISFLLRLTFSTRVPARRVPE